jgi:hypothetical protein
MRNPSTLRELTVRARAGHLAAALALAALGACAHAPPAAEPAAPLPEVVCQPCGDFVPHGFVCAGKVMVRSDVTAARTKELQRLCAASKKRS